MESKLEWQSKPKSRIEPENSNSNVQTQKSTGETRGNAWQQSDWRLRGRYKYTGKEWENWEQVQHMRAIRTEGQPDRLRLHRPQATLSLTGKGWSVLLGGEWDCVEEFKYLRVLFRSEGQMETLCIGDLWSQAVGSDRTNKITDTSKPVRLSGLSLRDTVRRPRGGLSTLRRGGSGNWSRYLQKGLPSDVFGARPTERRHHGDPLAREHLRNAREFFVAPGTETECWYHIIEKQWLSKLVLWENCSIMHTIFMRGISCCVILTTQLHRGLLLQGNDSRVGAK